MNPFAGAESNVYKQGRCRVIASFSAYSDRIFKGLDKAYGITYIYKEFDQPER